MPRRQLLNLSPHRLHTRPILLPEPLQVFLRNRLRTTTKNEKEQCTVQGLCLFFILYLLIVDTTGTGTLPHGKHYNGGGGGVVQGEQELSVVRKLSCHNRVCIVYVRMAYNLVGY